MENKPTRRLPWATVLVVVALVCVIAYFAATQLANWRMPQLRKATAVSARSGQTIHALKNGMAYYDGTTVHALDGNGRQMWSHAAGGGADFSVGDGGIAIWMGTSLSLVNADNGTVPFTGTVEGPVISAYFGTNYAAVQIGQSIGGVTQEHNSVMLLLDTGGRQIDRIELPNQTVLDFGFFTNGTLFWVMSLDTEGTEPLCSVSTYKPGRMLAGTISDTEQMLYDVMFQSTQLRVVGLTNIKDYKYDSKEIIDNRILVYGWYLMDVDESKNNPLMVFVPKSEVEGGAGISDVRLIQGQHDQTIRLPSAAEQVFAKKDTLYAFSNDRVMVCSVGATEPSTFMLPVHIDNVIALTDNQSAIVTSGGSVYMIPLQ